MAAPNEKLAESLDVLKALQEGGQRVFSSDDLSRVHRERLVENGFLQEVMKGWLISSSPGARAGDSTPWYASFWEFCARYSGERFGDEWHLSAGAVALAARRKDGHSGAGRGVQPEGHQSPDQTFVRHVALRPESAGNAAGTESRDEGRPAPFLAGGVAGGEWRETFFARNPVESQVVLASLADASDLLRLLLDGGNSTKAGLSRRRVPADRARRAGG